MKIRLIFFIFFTLLVVIEGKYCETRLDCNPCFHCHNETKKCIPVDFLKDPYLDCPEMCGTPMACGFDQRCVLKHTPSCICNFSSGQCIVNHNIMSNQTCIDIFESVQAFTGVSLMCTLVIGINFLLILLKRNKKKSN